MSRTIPLLVVCILILAFSYWLSRRTLARLEARAQLEDRRKTEAELLSEFEKAISSACEGDNEYIFQVYYPPFGPAAHTWTCIRIFHKNKYLMGISADSARLSADDSPSMFQSALISSSLVEIMAKIKEMKTNFGFEFFTTSVKRLSQE